MKKLFFIATILCSTITFSQKEKVIAYIDLYKNVAIKEMQRTGVPASITLAQAILESQFGESVLSKQSNNHFGIKCKTEWTGEKVYHDDDEKQECFRKYPNVEQSFIDHSDFLKNRPYYTSLFKLDITDYVAWAKGLKQCGYATERNYPESLTKLINEYNLHQYTLLALANPNANDSALAIIPSDNKENFGKSQPTSNPSVTEAIYIKTPTVTVVEDEKDEVEQVTKSDNIKAIKPKNIYPDGVFKINTSKVIFATQGTSLLSLALEYNISLSKIFEFNDMNEMEFVDVDRLIFIEKKQKKGETDFYTVQPNENFHDISQKLGIQLQVLADLNGIHKKLNPLAGEKLYLKTKSLVSPKAGMADNSIKPNLGQ